MVIWGMIRICPEWPGEITKSRSTYRAWGPRPRDGQRRKEMETAKVKFEGKEYYFNSVALTREAVDPITS